MSSLIQYSFGRKQCWCVVPIALNYSMEIVLSVPQVMYPTLSDLELEVHTNTQLKYPAVPSSLTSCISSASSTIMPNQWKPTRMSCCSKSMLLTPNIKLAPLDIIQPHILHLWKAHQTDKQIVAELQKHFDTERYGLG